MNGRNLVILGVALVIIVALLLLFLQRDPESKLAPDRGRGTAVDVGSGRGDVVAEGVPAATPAELRLAAYQQRLDLHKNSLLANVAFRSIGPTIMSGRAVDLDASPADPTNFYVAYASGGLWKTENDGISFAPRFDEQAVMTIGDIAVDWAGDETIWVGTGENNSSRSSYSGTGIYKSTDRGQSWQHMGLGESHHIGRIVIHPTDPNTVWVAALGHLYSFNPERGVYKTTDGGQSWRQTLFIDDTTGVIDLVLDPNDANVLYAAAWHRYRFAWDFVGNGAGSGIYKSSDGGENWQRLNVAGSGLPADAGVGRIGLAVFPGNSQILYASVDNQNRRPEESDEEKPALTKEMLRTMSREEFAKVNEQDINDYLDRNNFPEKYTAKEIAKQIAEGKLQPRDLVDYLEDANAQLFDTPVVGAEVYRSDDGGKTWRRTHDDFIDNVFYSYGYYFGEIRVAADNADRIYLLGVPLLKSTDGGKSFTSIGESNVHVDHHALWLNPNRPGHLINGNDGGVNISYDDGKTWFKANTPAVGQFYAIAVDMAEPYNVYGGLQDNGVWAGPSTYEQDYRWYATGDYAYDMLLGGDGMQVEIDTRDNNTIYTGFQFGFYSRIDKRSGKRTAIKPQHELGERPLRFNWQSPIRLSRHNQDILYFGANKLFRSMNRGDDFIAISGDLTQGGRPGNVPYGTLTSIDESIFRFGLLYAGSDDGLVHVTQDGGTTWRRISDNLPQNLWVSRVIASRHDTATVYVALNGYRYDDFTAYLYRSTNYGRTWESLAATLPHEPINAVAEDPQNASILYTGTDHGLYVSLDGGKSFMAMMKHLPHAPVHDLVVHPRENELVVGTHGRSIYVANVAHVQELTPELQQQPVHVFTIKERTYSDNWGRQRASWMEANEPEMEIAFFVNRSARTSVRIQTTDGLVLRELQDDSERGLNYLAYDLSIDSTKVRTYQERLNAMQQTSGGETVGTVKPADNGKVYLRPGTYVVEVIVGGDRASQEFTIKAPQRRKRGG